MKMLFLFRALPHYTNFLLNRFNAAPGVEVVSVVPTQLFDYGGGVYQSFEDIEYRLIQLEEVPSRCGRLTFRGLAGVLFRERPAIVVTMPEHVRSLVLDPVVRAALLVSRSRIIMKSIPFRLAPYDVRREGLSRLDESALGRRPQLVLRSVERVTRTMGLGERAAAGVRRPVVRAMVAVKRLKERVALEVERRAYRAPRAHVNYVRAGRGVYGSYGVPPERIFVTSNSPDTDRLLAAREEVLRQGAPVKHRRRIIHVGRLVAWKRVDLLLRAFSRIAGDYDDAELVVVGVGPMEDEWKELAVELGVADRVRFAGGIYDPVELGRELMSAGVFVLAGMGGLALNDAMSFGLPVICSTCDGTEEDLVDDGVNGLFFRDNDREDLERKLRALLDEPSRSAEMGENALAKIRDEVNIHTVVARYVEAFEHVLGRPWPGGGSGEATQG